MSLLQYRTLFFEASISQEDERGADEKDGGKAREDQETVDEQEVSSRVSSGSSLPSRPPSDGSLPSRPPSDGSLPSRPPSNGSRVGGRAKMEPERIKATTRRLVYGIFP